MTIDALTIALRNAEQQHQRSFNNHNNNNDNDDEHHNKGHQYWNAYQKLATKSNNSTNATPEKMTVSIINKSNNINDNDNNEETSIVLQKQEQEQECYDDNGRRLRHDEQVNEDYYDERSDADDDLEKGKIRFPKNKLYGRNKELKQLHHSFWLMTQQQQQETSPQIDERKELDHDENSKGTGQVLFLPGYSGVGKSALVQHFIKELENRPPIISSKSDSSSSRQIVRPRFISCKYEEMFTSCDPYSAIAEGINKFFAIMLHSKNPKDQQDLQDIQSNLLDCSLGSNHHGSVIADIIPNLTQVLESGDTSETSTLCSSSSARSQDLLSKPGLIKHVFRNFIKCLCSPERPLILFLDDLQWIDEASMELISTLLSDVNLKHFFFIGAYRFNEVPQDHPVAVLIKDLKSKRPVEQIELKDLSIQHIGGFIADTLSLDVDEVLPLTKAIYKITLGNIFFTRQAMEELVRQNGLYYDVMFFKWEWNLSKIEQENQLSSNVVAMVKSKIQNLCKPLQHILLVASFTRSTLDLATLRQLVQATLLGTGADLDIISEEEKSEDPYIILGNLEQYLQCAVVEGLMTMTVTLSNASKGIDVDQSINTTEFTFAHDRIQEAAQALMDQQDDMEKYRLCLGIARVLERLSATANGDDWMLFTAVNHMNKIPLHMVEGGAVYLVQLNLRAAELAISRSAFRKAVELLRFSVSCLDNTMNEERKWSDHYSLCLNLYNHLIETEYAVGNHSEAQEAVNQVLNNATCEKDKLLAQFHHVEIYTNNKDRDYVGAVKISLNFLESHGISLPQDPGDARLVTERLKLRMAQGRRKLWDMSELTPMDDYHEQVMRLISQLSHSCLMSGKIKMNMVVNITAMRLTWMNGFNIHLPPMLSFYSSLLRRQGKLAESCNIAQAAEEMLHKIGEGPSWVRGMSVTRGGSISMRLPYSECIDVSNAMHRIGVACGDCQWGLLGAMQACIMVYAAGAPINSLFEAKILLCEEQCKSFGLSASLIVTFRIFRQTLLNLHGKYKLNEPSKLDGKALNEESALSEFDGDTYKQTFRDISIYRLMLACIYTDRQGMEELLSERFESSIADFDLVVPRQHLKDVFVGLAAMFLARRYKKDLMRNGVGDAKILSKKYYKMARSKQEIFQKLSKIGSKNAVPVLLCFAAEEKPSQSRYDKAIRACSESGMLHLEGLMNEWCALYLLEGNSNERENVLANQYLTNAYWCYSDWAAKGKVNQLQGQYPFLQKIRRKVTGMPSHVSENRWGADSQYYSESSNKNNSGPNNIGFVNIER